MAKTRPREGQENKANPKHECRNPKQKRPTGPDLEKQSQFAEGSSQCKRLAMKGLWKSTTVLGVKKQSQFVLCTAVNEKKRSQEWLQRKCLDITGALT